MPGGWADWRGRANLVFLCKRDGTCFSTRQLGDNSKRALLERGLEKKKGRKEGNATLPTMFVASQMSDGVVEWQIIRLPIIEIAREWKVHQVSGWRDFCGTNPTLTSTERPGEKRKKIAPIWDSAWYFKEA
jgi:hypothetical protein